jgi:hypothetical protein
MNMENISMYVSMIKNLYVFLFVVCSAFLFLSCDNFVASKSVSSQKSSSPQELISNKPKLKEQSEQKQFSFNGVSFQYEQSLAKEIVIKKTKAMLTCDPNFRPDGCEPPNLSFQFLGDYATQHSDSSFHPEIIIYPITEYIRMFQKSEDYSNVLNAKFQRLNSILWEQPLVINGEYPFIPFVDATQILHSHLSYLSFEDGKGIAFITQINNADPVLVNNRGIVYIFQGITSDGKYFISATFPLKASFLPNSPYAENQEGYTIPDNFYDKEKLFINKENYKKYLLNVEQKLNLATEEQFTPNLEDLRKLLSSLEVKQQVLKRSL